MKLKWLQNGIPFQARCLDLPKFLISAVLASIAKVFR
jgi:hypothetical protein